MACCRVLFIVMVLVVPLIEGTQFCHWMKTSGSNGGRCPSRIRCIGTIRDVTLHEECQGSSNDRINVELVLDKYDERMERTPLTNEDIGFLGSITFLKINTERSQTNLNILFYMNRLKNLDLSNNHINHINVNEKNESPFCHLYSLETLSIARNRISVIDELFQFEYPNKLKELSLAHNEIQILYGTAFSELSSLKELDLSYNQISDLTEEPFMNLTNLEVLKLNNNNIKDLNGAVNNLLSLKQLFIKDNQIDHINTASLKIIYELETFDISGNQLANIGSIMFSRHWQHFSDVCKIKMANNQIAAVPNTTSEHVSSRHSRQLREYGVDVLTELDLSNNSITTVEYNAFHSIPRLTNLDLSRNKIKEFIVNSSDLVYLKYLNLSTNSIVVLHLKSFSSLINLQNLDLSFNKLNEIPELTFETHHFLKYFNLSSNVITNARTLRIKMFHPEGGVLDLSNNGLTKLRIPSGEGLRLTHLILHSNNIFDLSLIHLDHRQSELKVLDVSNNLIFGLKSRSLQLPNTLVSLDLSYNNITFVEPGAFKDMSQLKTLRLSHNHLKSLEFGIFQGLMTLQNLDLSYNKIPSLDSKIFIDLKFLVMLSLRYNEMNYMDYNIWLSHKFELNVFVEGNNFTCQWLGRALNDYNNGVSRMKLIALEPSTVHHSLENIPCVQEQASALIDASSYTVYDEKLLITSQKILEAVMEQTSYLRTIINSMNLDPKPLFPQRHHPVDIIHKP